MGLNITKATDPILVETLKFLIYGQPGIGKTSLAFTASNALNIDFDIGVHRAVKRKDSKQIRKWEDALEILDNPDDLKEYDTLIIDTGGSMLDVITEYLITNNPKITRKNGSLTIDGYQSLKITFTNYIKRISRMGKDLIIICHDREDRDGEEIIARPDLSAANYLFCVKVVDLMGRYHIVGENRVLDFNLSENHVGKNCAKLPPLKIPHEEESEKFDGYLGNLIEKVKSRLNNVGEAQPDTNELFREYSDRIKNAKKPLDFDKLAEDLNELNDGPIKNSMRSALHGRVKELGVKYYKHLQRFRKENDELDEKEKEYMASSKETGEKAVKRVAKALED